MEEGVFYLHYYEVVAI